MKAAIILFLITILTACKGNIDPQLLKGTWKAQDETNKAGLNSYSTITFSDSNSITAKTYAYGNLVSEISGKYKVTPTSNILTTSYGDSISYQLEIVKLTAKELDLYYLETKQHQRYLRY
jgi:hypothetical protein